MKPFVSNEFHPEGSIENCLAKKMELQEEAGEGEGRAKPGGLFQFSSTTRFKHLLLAPGTKMRTSWNN